MIKKLLSILLLLASSFFVQQAFAKCDTVTMTEMNWPSAGIMSAVAKFLIENGYECKVTLVPSSTLPAITSVAETGKPDILLELWENSAQVYQDLKSEGKIVAASSSFTKGGLEGWWIPAYLAKSNPELTKLDGILANPEAVKRFHNCPSGWACEIVNNNNIKAIDLGKKMEIFNHGSGETLAASIASAYENKEPWFGYYWGPTAVLGKYNMVKVDVGGYVKENHDCNVEKNCPNPRLSDYPSSTVVNIYTNTFEEKNPEVAELIKNMTYDNNLMNKLLAWQDEKGASSEETAAYFLTNYKKLWKSWINDEAKKRLANIL